jgi:hypothetical protein
MRKDSQDSLLQQWDRLLKAVHRYEARLGGIAPFRDALERAYSQAVSSKRRREVARAAAEDATRALRESLETAFDASVSLRGFIKSLIGFRSEMLREFGMTPRKKRPRPCKKPPVGFERPR